jgi:hypothetical protein
MPGCPIGTSTYSTSYSLMVREHSPLKRVSAASLPPLNSSAAKIALAATSTVLNALFAYITSTLFIAFRYVFCLVITMSHRIPQEWTGMYFKNTDLYSLGLSLQLGHTYGEPCLHPQLGDSNFLVIHTNGIHRVRIKFCDCPCVDPVPFNRQLLQAGWWPGSLKKPKTCATLAVLTHFHKQTLQGKLSAFDFYRALELETDNSGLMYLPVGSLFLHAALTIDL